MTTIWGFLTVKTSKINTDKKCLIFGAKTTFLNHARAHDSQHFHTDIAQSLQWLGYEDGVKLGFGPRQGRFLSSLRPYEPWSPPTLLLSR